jgi:hypothetical protein
MIDQANLKLLLDDLVFQCKEDAKTAEAGFIRAKSRLKNAEYIRSQLDEPAIEIKTQSNAACFRNVVVVSSISPANTEVKKQEES